MLRSVLTVALVASLAAWIARAERRAPEAAPPPRPATAAAQSRWVRTADGWQPREVLAIKPPVADPIHPGLIAGFQLVFSLLALAAFPGKAKPAATSSGLTPSVATSRPPAEPASRKRRRRIRRVASV